jgi:hypothetical protein
LFVLKIEADIQDFEFEVHSEYEQKKTFATTHNALKQISNF